MLNSNTLNPLEKTVYVDADACPVKEEIVEICYETFPVVFVLSVAHTTAFPPCVTNVTVDSEQEAVDLYIMNHIKKGDVCVTQDYALAAILLSKGANVICPRGNVYREETINFLLHSCHVSQRKRRGGKRVKGPKAFTKKDRHHFKEQLQMMLST